MEAIVFIWVTNYLQNTKGDQVECKPYLNVYLAGLLGWFLKKSYINCKEKEDDTITITIAMRCDSMRFTDFKQFYFCRLKKSLRKVNWRWGEPSYPVPLLESSIKSQFWWVHSDLQKTSILNLFLGGWDWETIKRSWVVNKSNLFKLFLFQHLMEGPNFFHNCFLQAIKKSEFSWSKNDEIILKLFFFFKHQNKTWTISFSNFSCMFLNPNNFFQFEF